MTRLDVGLGAVMVVALIVGLVLTLANRTIPEYVEALAYAAAGGFGVRQHHRIGSRRGNR